MNLTRTCFPALGLYLGLVASGCGDSDGDDVAKKKVSIPIDQVPAAVLVTARKQAPEFEWFAAAKDQHDGKDSIELKGKSKNGKIKELEIAPDGSFLGEE